MASDSKSVVLWCTRLENEGFLIRTAFPRAREAIAVQNANKRQLAQRESNELGHSGGRGACPSAKRGTPSIGQEPHIGLRGRVPTILWLWPA